MSNNNELETSEDGEVLEGIVIWFDSRKGFGFIKQDSDPDADMFLHWSNIEVEGFRTVKPNQRVGYSVGENSNGPQAVNVRLIGTVEE